jgi:hypothetical protein
LCTASNPVCTTSMKPITHLFPASYSVCTIKGSWWHTHPSSLIPSVTTWESSA